MHKDDNHQENEVLNDPFVEENSHAQNNGQYFNICIVFGTYQFTNMIKEVVQSHSLDQIDPFLESNPPPQAEGV